jgi:hypothetical protein
MFGINRKNVYKNPYTFFKNYSLRELKAFFKDVVPEVYVSNLYSLVFLSGVGLLATFGTEEHDKMLAAFQEFLEKCEKITSEAAAKEKEMLNRNPSAKVESWIKWKTGEDKND